MQKSDEPELTKTVMHRTLSILTLAHFCHLLCLENPQFLFIKRWNLHREAGLRDTGGLNPSQ